MQIPPRFSRTPILVATAAVCLLGCRVSAETFFSTLGGSGLDGPVEAEFVTVGGITYLRGTTVIKGCYSFYAGITGELEDGLLLSIGAGYIPFCICGGGDIWEGEGQFACPATPVAFATVLGSFPPGSHPLSLWGVRSDLPVTMVVPELQEPALRLTVAGDTVTIQVNGFNEVQYVVEHSGDLKAWTVVDQRVGPGAFQRPVENGHPGFYRLRADNRPLL